MAASPIYVPYKIISAANDSPEAIANRKAYQKEQEQEKAEAAAKKKKDKADAAAEKKRANEACKNIQTKNSNWDSLSKNDKKKPANTTTMNVN